MSALLGLLLACPACFGDPDSDQVLGAKAGVLVLLAIVVGLLGGIAFVARSWARRARALEGAPAEDFRWFALQPRRRG